ncbi:ImmA/IrrE family metallo-endopeptidase [Chloroflexota bacterium]
MAATYPLFEYRPPNNELNDDAESDKATMSIIEKANDLTFRLIKVRGHENPPFSPFEYTKLLNIEVNKADLHETSAVLLKIKNGYLITLNHKHNLARQNFSCAHEIGHMLLSEVEPYIQDVEFRTFKPQAVRVARQRAKERLCDIAATELLMPKNIFRRYLLNIGGSINSIEKLAAKFNVSIQAAAIRVSEVSLEPCITLIWKPLPKNKPKKLVLPSHIGTRKSSNKNNYVPKVTKVLPKETLYQAYQTDRYIKSRKDIVIDNTTKRLNLESKGFGTNEKRYVVSFAYIDR